MKSACHLSRCVQSLYRAFGSLRVDSDPAHLVMDRGSDFHLLLRDIHPREIHELVVHAWQLLLDEFRPLVRDIEIDSTVTCAPPGEYLRVDRPSDDISGRKFHPFWVVLGHKALSLCVCQYPPFSPHSFGHK